MAVAHFALVAGHGDIQRLRRETLFQRLFRQQLFPGVQRFLQRRAHVVCQLTHDGTLLGSELAHLL